MKKIYSSLLFSCLILFSIQTTAQTTFRLSYDVGAFDIAGGMIETPAGEFVIAGLNNSFGPYYGNAVKIDNAGTVLWAKAYTGGFATNFSDIKNVSTGGYIITGSSTSGGGGALLVRLDAAGVVLWAKKYQLPDKPTGNTSNEYGNAVIETSDGGFIVGGGVDFFWDGVSGATVDTASALAFKVDAAGTLIWNKVWTLTNPTKVDEHYINDVAESADGYFFVGESADETQAYDSDGDLPRNALIIKTDKAAGTTTYIRRWGNGGTSSQGINSAIKLSTGNILLGGYDDVHGFLVSISGTGSVTPSIIFNRRLNGSAFGSIYLIQDILENSDGNYSLIGTQLNPFSFPIALNTMIVKLNSSTGALIFGRTYAPIGLSAILPEGGLCSDQGYYVSMTDQQTTGFNYNVIRTNNVGQLGAGAAGCNSTNLSPALGTESVTFTTPASANYSLATSSAFTPTVTNMTPTNIPHCLNTACIPPIAATTVTATPATICAGQSSTITASGAGAGVGYNVYTASTGGTNLGATPLVVSPGTTTTYYVESYLTANPTCVSTTRVAVTVTVTPVVTPTTGFSYTTPVCANGTNPTPIPVGGFTSGGTYTSTAGLTLNSGTGLITLSSSTPGTYSVTYSVAASGCNPAGSSTTSITINPVTTPVTGFSYTTPVCANAANPSPTPVGGFTAGGTYSSTAGLTINSGTGLITLSSSTPGTYTVTYSVAASGCMTAGSGTASITINPVITPVTGFSYPTPICANASNPSPTPVGGFTAGGTYSSTAGLTINSGTGLITLSSTTPGTYTVTYSVAAAGCMTAGSGTATITINPVTSPVTGFSYTSPVCANGINPSPIPVGGFTTGGTYGSTAGVAINASSGVIDLGISTPGTYTVTYSVPATACGPAGSSTTSITISPTTTPVTGFSYTSPVCANGIDPVPSTVAGFTSGGTFSSTAGLSVNGATGIISLSASTPGTYTVTYSVAASGCMVAGSSTTSITINPTTTPTTSFSYTTPVCANGIDPTPIPGGGFTSGGTYSSTAGLTIGGGTGNINLATTTPGTYSVTYSVPASGCMTAGSGTASITIDPTTTPTTTFSYTTPVCANGIDPTPIPGGGFTTGGSYSSTSGLTIDTGTGNISLSTTTPGTYTVTYSVPAAGCMIAGSGTANITINPVTIPVTGFSYTSPVCASGTNPVPSPVGGFTNGGVYSSTAGLTVDGATGVIDLIASTPGTYTVTYSVAATICGPAGSSTASITIDPVVTPVTGFSYTTPVCANGIDPTPIPGGGFTTGGSYSSTSGLTIDTGTGNITLSTTTPGTYTVTYSVPAAGCMVAGSGTANITINPVTTPVTGFSYTSPVCASGTNPTPAPVGGFTNGGVYSSTAGLTVDGATGVIDLIASTPGTYTVTYSVAATICGPAGSSTTSITIDPVVTPVTGFSYTTPVCANGTNPVPAPAGGFTVGGIYSSTAGLTINSSSGIIDLNTSTPGTYSVTYSVVASGCMAAGSSTASITILPVTTPVTGFSYTSPVCANGTNPPAIPISGFTTGGTYSSAAGLTINSSTGTITLSSSTPGTYTVTYSVAATACGPAGSSTASITINSAPTAIAGSSPVCAGGILNLTSSGGTSYVWSGPIGFTSGSQNPTISPAGTGAAGTYTVTVTNSSGCSATATTTATVNTSPSINISGTTTVCMGSSSTLTASGATTYSWNTGALTPTLTVTPPATTTFTVTGTNVNGCSSTQTATVTTTSAPVATITGNPNVCDGESTTLTAGGGTAYLWSNGSTTQTITVSPSLASTYSVVVGTACLDTASINITVGSIPSPSITGNTIVILGSGTTLTASGGTSYLWTPSSGLSCDTCAVTTATPTIATQYCVTTTNSSGCSDSTCVDVRVDIECGELFIPTAFSPNGDNENDRLKVMIGYVGCIEEINFAIFDRWGEKIFETSDPEFAVNDGWDGIYKGKPLDTNVFVYYLKAKVSGTEVSKHGNITLVK